MPFSQDTITAVNLLPVSGGLRISWSSSSPAGTVYQIYADGQLAEATKSKSTVLPISEFSYIDVGTVASGEDHTNFSSSLPVHPKNRALLSWTGGLYEAPDLSGFRIYGETTAGGGIDYTTPLGDIQAYAEGLESDGMGMGGFGEGGFGSASASFSWTSEPYKTGVWSFAVVPYDALGNEGTRATITQALVSAPAEIPFRPDGTRLHYTYSQSLKEITLTWLASTG